MEIKIKSKKLGETLTFWKQSETDSYVYVDLNGESGCLGRQICYEGELLGVCIHCTDAAFERVCRRWYKQHIRDAVID